MRIVGECKPEVPLCWPLNSQKCTDHSHYPKDLSYFINQIGIQICAPTAAAIDRQDWIQGQLRGRWITILRKERFTTAPSFRRRSRIVLICAFWSTVPAALRRISWHQYISGCGQQESDLIGLETRTTGAVDFETLMQSLILFSMSPRPQ